MFYFKSKVCLNIMKSNVMVFWWTSLETLQRNYVFCWKTKDWLIIRNNNVCIFVYNVYLYFFINLLILLFYIFNFCVCLNIDLLYITKLGFFLSLTYRLLLIEVLFIIGFKVIKITITKVSLPNYFKFTQSNYYKFFLSSYDPEDVI